MKFFFLPIADKCTDCDIVVPLNKCFVNMLAVITLWQQRPATLAVITIGIEKVHIIIPLIEFFPICAKLMIWF